MTIIEQIKAEIKGWLREYAEDSQFELGERYGYKRLLSFLDTIESGKPMDLEWLEEELDKWRHEHFHGKRDDHFSGEYLERTSQLELARYFAQWGAEHLADACKTSQSNLEEAARQYFENPENSWEVKEVFIAGAKLGAEQFAKIVRANLSEIGNNAQSQFEQFYFEITGTKMYGGYND